MLEWFLLSLSVLFISARFQNGGTAIRRLELVAYSPSFWRLFDHDAKLTTVASASGLHLRSGIECGNFLRICRSCSVRQVPALHFVVTAPPSACPSEPTLTPLQFPRIVGTELQTPAPDRLIRHDDSPFAEKILDISQAQAEAMVRSDRIANDLGRKTIAIATRPIALHGISLSVPCRS